MSTTTAAAALTDVLSSPLLSFRGRWDPYPLPSSSSSPPRKQTAVWAGSSIHFRTSSPQVVFGLSARSAGEIVWKVGDGNVKKRMVIGRADVVLCEEGDGSGEGERSVEVVVGEMGGLIEVFALKVQGTILPPILPRAPPLHILVTGASQTSGFSPPQIHPPILPHSTYSAWPLLLSRALGAQLTLVARPGLRLVTAEKPFFEEGLDRRFWKGWEGEGGWRPGAEDPEIIFSSIGTNDSGQHTPAAVFTTTYHTLLDRWRTSFPKLRHIILVSPFGIHLPSPPRRVAIYEPAVPDFVAQVSEEWEKEGYEQRVWFCDTAGWVGPRECLDGLHPGEEGHRMIAARLREWVEERGIV